MHCAVLQASRLRRHSRCMSFKVAGSDTRLSASVYLPPNSASARDSSGVAQMSVSDGESCPLQEKLGEGFFASTVIGGMQTRPTWNAL
jgi:hypothetical protein